MKKKHKIKTAIHITKQKKKIILTIYLSQTGKKGKALKKGFLFF